MNVCVCVCVCVDFCVCSDCSWRAIVSHAHHGVVPSLSHTLPGHILLSLTGDWGGGGVAVGREELTV